jgi:DNA-binding MarR family transcriptional regulator
MIVAIRRIIRAVDIHSRSLIRDFSITTPQLLVLRTIKLRGEETAARLSEQISLSQPTMTGIVRRLSDRGLIQRRRSKTDRRKVMLRLTDKARDVLASAPSPLQDSFLERYQRLPEWEQTQILSAFQRVVSMMEAGTIDASPVLTTDVFNSANPTSNVP